MTEKEEKITLTGKLSYQQQQKGMRNVIFAQCTGFIGPLAFYYGIMLLFMKKCGIDTETIMILLALPLSMQSTISLPIAYLSDIYGKKIFGIAGLIVSLAGFALILAAPNLSGYTYAAVVMGVLLFSIGAATAGANWFGLLSDVVPTEIRGRFLGKMRFSWQAVGIVFFIFTAIYMNKETPMVNFQILLVIILIMMTLKLFFYRRIPEIKIDPKKRAEGFLLSILEIMRIPGYSSFCSYAFLLRLAIGCFLTVFSLMQKEQLGFGDNEIIVINILTMFGSLPGFFLGGKIVDKYGTKSVFLGCHFSYGLILLAYLIRGFVPLPMVLYLGILHFLFGFIGAASSISITTEIFGLASKSKNVSIAASCVNNLHVAGGALSSIIAAAVLKLKILNRSWMLFGLKMTEYDSIILFGAITIVFLVITLGLVPSVIQKSQWQPRGL